MFSLFHHPQLRPRHYAGGVVVISFIILFYGGALSSIFALGGELQWRAWFTDDYLQHLILFSFGQALLSTVLSIFFGLLLARALFYKPFFGKKWLLKLMSLTFVLPALVVIFGLIGIYGSSGWLAWLANLFGMSWQGHIYGLSGILIAHLFSISHWQHSFSYKVCKVSLISNVSLQPSLICKVGNLLNWWSGRFFVSNVCLHSA